MILGLRVEPPAQSPLAFPENAGWPDPSVGGRRAMSIGVRTHSWVADGVKPAHADSRGDLHTTESLVEPAEEIYARIPTGAGLRRGRQVTRPASPPSHRRLGQILVE